MLTRDQAINRAANLLIPQARAAGEAAGIDKSIAAVEVLEQSLAIAWADVAMWGGNDSFERREEAIRLMRQRLGEAIRLQHFMRKGS